jgi:4-amino-4-deoxy-L-arabinose transferase-like glycosyltransferase
MKSQIHWIFLVVFTLVGLSLRLSSFFLNDLPHGDINLDYAAAWSFRQNGRLMIPVVAPHPYPTDDVEIGYPLEQHAPLWPLMGAIGSFIFGDIFTTFKIFTLIFGSLLIPVSYFAFRRLIGQKPALMTSLIVACTYILIDYSGNGSLYIFHALIFLLFIFFSYEPERMHNAIILGILAGTAYLINYQAAILLAVLVALYIIRYQQTKRLKASILALGVSFGVSFIVISPWLFRNFQAFGSPFYSANFSYLLSNLGVPRRLTFGNAGLVYESMWSQYPINTLPQTFLAWFLRNGVYFFIRILILAPVISVFAFLLVVSLIRRKHHAVYVGTFWSTVLLLALHLLISCVWPVFKFRYFVPLMPLIIALGCFGIFSQIRRNDVRNGFIILSILSLMAVDGLTYVRVPSHTNYYDSNELAHWRTGEAEWQKQIRSMQLAAQELDFYESGTVIADIPVFYFTHQPIIRAVDITDQDILRALVKEYNVRYVLDVVEKQDFFANALQGKLIYANDAYMLMKIDASIE